MPCWLRWCASRRRSWHRRSIGSSAPGCCPDRACRGDILKGRTHFDHAIALYDPTEHHPLMTHFGQDERVAILSYRPSALWLLGYPEAALAGAHRALKEA